MRRTLAIFLCGLFFAAHTRAARDDGPVIIGQLVVVQQTITVFGQQIAYYEAGQGRAVVLLSNLGWDSHAWSQNMRALAAHYRVLAIDVLGTGASSKPLVDYKMDTWTDVIAELLRLKGIQKAIIVGAVMGGALAVQFTLDHPEMSEGFVCAASNSGPGEHAGGIAVLPWTSLAGTKRGLMAAFYDKSLITDDVVRARFAYRLQAGDGYTIQRHLSDHRARYSVEELSAIRVPALFVWCREDEITPLKWGEDFAAAVPGARLAVLSGCGHLPNLEKPHDFNQAVLGFLLGLAKQ